MDLSIGEVARRAGIAASAIRYYESERLIDEPARRSGRRLYDPAVLDRLAIIELAKNAGFTISETRDLFHGFESDIQPGERWNTLAKRKLVELDRRIEEAQRMKQVLEKATSCRCPTFEVCGQAIREKVAAD